ncbi:exocyst complex component EXO84A [Primulina eburnea]|uniref:exocyst complex component EXO84A n=1 Tax=Primulina eburnea TaxID=1245227 RepID=UPI003C6C6A51
MERGSFSSSKGSDSADFEVELTLSDKLKVFKSSQFDPDSYVTTRCRAMSEKEIRHLCIYLIDLKKASAEEMRTSVYANYASFIRTSREISDLEGELVSLKNLLSSRAKFVHSIADGVRMESLHDGTDSSSRTDDATDFEDREPTSFDKWLSEFIETLEILLAERRVDEALAALEEGENILEEAKNRPTFASSALVSLKKTIMEHRQKLADQLAEAVCQPSTSGVELRSAVQAMKRLGDGPRAHTLLLKSHQQKLQRDMQCLRPSISSYGTTYTTTLSHHVFSTIAQAASDSLAIFNDEPAFTSELVTWAVNQTEAFAVLIKKNVVAIPAASGCLRVVTDSVRVCFGHCLVLESHGLALFPTLFKIFRPCLEQALNANLKRIDLCTAAIAAADDWSLAYSPIGSRSLATGSVSSIVMSQPKLSSSAHRFNTMVQELCEDIGSLDILQYSEQSLEGVLLSFNSYINMMINAFPGSIETENLEGSGRRIVKMAESETQQIALLANALLLADELLPRATSKLWSCNKSQDQLRALNKQDRAPEQRELKRRLQRFVDQLRDSFCRQHALELIFTEDGGVRLGAEMYLSMDCSRDEPEWFPSPVYQELFAKLTRIATITSDMFVGRERFATVLLMRLTETVILWLSDDQNFWEEIEYGERPLGPLGLQQFYLDMEFVILFSSQGRYLSRNLHQVIKNIISRAIEAVQATKIDPYSELPEDEWFADVAQIAIKMLSGKANFGNTDRDMSSPTASVSARSVSSVHSHGST